MIIIKCKDCDSIEEFKNKEEAKDNNWHKIGCKWICDSCFEEDYTKKDDEDYEDSELEDEEDEDEDKELELDEEDETTNNTNNIIFFPGTRGNMHSSLKKVWDNKEDEVWEDY